MRERGGRGGGGGRCIIVIKNDGGEESQKYENRRTRQGRRKTTYSTRRKAQYIQNQTHRLKTPKASMKGDKEIKLWKVDFREREKNIDKKKTG